MKNFTPVLRIAVSCFLIVSAIISCKKDNQTNPPPAVKPVVTNVQPKDPMPGDVVTITGTGFGSIATDVKVTIGAQVVTITSVTTTEIKFTLPAGITAGDIAVAIKNVIANNTDPQKATITPKPSLVPAATITSINPTSGKVGDVVTITGTNFSATATDDVVKFNGVTATVSAATTTALTVSVPATATTGTISLSVKSAAIITGPSFTINTSTGGTGSPINYIKVLGGTATVSKIASAPAEIGAMVVDKKNNVLYYADYTVFAASHAGTVYKLKLDGSAPTPLTTDSRINTVFNLGVDATGNVIVFTGVDKQGINVNVYKVDPGTGSVTGLATNVNLGGGNYPLVVDSQGGIWNGYGQKLNTATNKFDRNATFPYTSYTSTFYQGDGIYVDNASGTDVGFVKYNLLTKNGTSTDFTLQALFKQDNADIGSNSHSLDVQSRYAIDNSENFYALYPIAGDAASFYNDYYVIRKTKNGTAAASSLLLKFTTPFNVPAYTQPRSNIGLLFQSDGAGNLYMKDNGTDIIKIIQ
ncbi:IPT/TIG domain-containing protein [Mucilaginibacter xinganensis]|uniref:IPT/TIG domain-containing protein n=1 Tax=Mucilaginibacter xinganensis TaxID=1234841 RepID=A0A223NWK0_9SPHI|nr:IPT/TIG domain-containing protein [Mucilaginibacter xinganensis]ASU34160.1 hypothetical protein MuYL_2271 [Mucilaginibacter xinganensis]